MLDQEWVNLIVEAKHLELTIEEIREFLNRNANCEKISKTG
ncbi:anti-repressor SinI family protein [Fredinandcohnia quinoae]|uniref:Anti-repressor SinI family protein n=1 Tax=Fredinandcohnia quinoae TaxID=2918902 RepID=A0AAW5E349_9BACI|nr:anti-repressor SinI family protein [Fredinandcohnia sp. SECRCQ15]MCH1625979.1 anti-repressor SinI family protein [Fredinandcohnia sp. SECRCQ15]